MEQRWASILSDFRKRAGLSKSDLARAAGVTIGYISKLEAGKAPPPELLRWRLCEILALTEEEREIFHIKAEIERADPTAVKYLLKWARHMPVQDPRIPQFNLRLAEEEEDPSAPALHKIPIINKAAAGYPQDFTDLDYPAGIADQYIAVPDVFDPNAFAFYAAGDSMEPDFPDGTLLIASPNTPLHDGDPAFVRFGPTCRVSGCSFKRLYRMSDGLIRLAPINRKYAEELFDPQDLAGVSPVIRWYGKPGRKDKVN
jgi:phage repressor protein C with HTH and peptisase S24 domain